jgi:hypothetical protein
MLRRMHRIRNAALSICVAALAVGRPAYAQSEVVTYSYDALGRLKQSTSSGTVNSGTVVTSTYDSADNRKTYTVSGTGKAGNGTRAIIVPLKGAGPIPLAPDVQ